MLEDKTIMWRFNQGQKQALRDIYEKYKNHLKFIAPKVYDPQKIYGS